MCYDEYMIFVLQLCVSWEEASFVLRFASVVFQLAAHIEKKYSISAYS